MKREVTKPNIEVRESGGLSDIVKTHPAFVMAGFSRVTGGHTRHFGSELHTSSFIRFKLVPAQEHWHLHGKRYHGNIRPLVEVDMTTAQFAELITTLNMGSGVPATLRYLDGKEIPDFEDEDTLQKQIKDDIGEKAKEVTDQVSKLLKDTEAMLTAAKVSQKNKESILSAIKMVQQNIKSNLPFILDQYREAVDEVTSAAKAEVDAFVTSTAMKLGVESLEQLKLEKK